MADEYIRLDATIIGIDGLINEAPTGSQARALLCAKDLIYDQQRYYSEMQPVKRGEWCPPLMGQGKCSTYCSRCFGTVMRNSTGIFEETPFCPHCGADMRGDENA